MTVSPKYWNSVAVTAFVLCIVASLTVAHGDNPASPPMKIAIVDISKVRSNYKLLVDYAKVVDAKKAAYDSTINVYKSNPLLSPQDQATLAALTLKSTTPAGLTPSEKTQMTQLTAQSQNALQLFQKLQTATASSLSAQDKQTLTNDVQMESSTETYLQSLHDQTVKDINAATDAKIQEAATNLKAAVATVAKEQGYTVVLDTQAVLFGGTDITNAVLKVLNK